MNKLFLVLLVAVLLSGCVGMTTQDACVMSHNTAYIYTATIADSLGDVEQLQDIVDGISATLDLTIQGTDDSTAVEVLSIIQCTIDGVSEGLQ